MSLFDEIREGGPLERDDRIVRVNGGGVKGTVMKRVRQPIGILVQWDDGTWSNTPEGMLSRALEEET